MKRKCQLDTSIWHQIIINSFEEFCICALYMLTFSQWQLSFMCKLYDICSPRSVQHTQIQSYDNKQIQTVWNKRQYTKESEKKKEETFLIRSKISENKTKNVHAKEFNKLISCTIKTNLICWLSVYVLLVHSQLCRAQGHQQYFLIGQSTIHSMKAFCT